MKKALHWILIMSFIIFPMENVNAAKYAQTFETLLTSQRAGGVTLAGGKAYFYIPGTTTLKAIYTDRNKTAAAANPYTLSSDGTAQVFGDGLYDIKITNASGVQKFYWEDVKIKDGAGLSTYQMSDYSTLSEALTAIGTTTLTGLTIDENVTVSADITIPANVHVTVVPGKVFTISAGKVLTINGMLEAGRYQIYSGSGRVMYGTASVSKVYPEWRGAKSDAVLSSGYHGGTSNSGAAGTDSSAAFKSTILDVELSAMTYVNSDLYRFKRTQIIDLISGGSYKAIGDNPLGVQSTLTGASTYWRFKGNGSRILWECGPFASNRCFGRLGKLTTPIIENVNIIPCAFDEDLRPASANRYGIVFSSNTADNTYRHEWTNGVFRNIGIGPGINIVFDIDVDAGSAIAGGAHDDVTIVENVNVYGFKKFIRFAQSEPVNWTLRKCQMFPYTDNAINFDISSTFSGGLFIEGCDFLVGNDLGHTVLKMSSATNSQNPVVFQNCRLETRNQNAYTFIDAVSGVVKVTGLQFDSGNATVPHVDTVAAKLGPNAIVEFVRCKLHNGFDIQLSRTAPISKDAVIAQDCYFIYSNSGVYAVRGYPTVKWRNNAGAYVTFADAVASTDFMRGVKVVPQYSQGGLALPANIGTLSSGEYRTATVFKNLSTGGYKSLHSPQNTWELPPYHLITSVKLYHYNVDASKVLSLTVSFRSGASADVNLAKTFSGTTSVYGEELLGTNHVIASSGETLGMYSIYRDPSSAIVFNEHIVPSGYLVITYRPSHSMADLPTGSIQDKVMF